MRIMMSAAGSPQAVGIIRHLKLLGHYVIGHDSCPYGPGAIFCDEWHVSPPADSPDYGRFVVSLDHDFRIPFLEEDFRLIGPRVFLSRPATIETFTDKHYQQCAMEHARLPVAPIGNVHEKRIYKPRRGRGGKGTFVAYPGDNVTGGEHLCQRFIEGAEYTIDTLTSFHGEFLFAVPRLRIATSGGVSTIGQIRMNEELIDIARQVCAKFKFAGPINIQVIRERDTGKVYIIEVNPRLSGSCMFTVIAGWDILADTIKVFNGEPFVPPERVWDIHVRRYYTEVKL